MCLAALALIVLGLPLAAVAQETGRLWRIGLLSAYSVEVDKPNRAALLDGLRKLGYAEGRNVVIEQRHADGRPERFPALAVELVQSKVDIFVFHGFPEAILRVSVHRERLDRSIVNTEIGAS